MMHLSQMVIEILSQRTLDCATSPLQRTTRIIKIINSVKNICVDWCGNVAMHSYLQILDCDKAVQENMKFL